MTDLVIIKAKLKELVRGYNMSSDFVEELDKMTKELISSALKRAEANGRKTVMGRDV